MSLARCHRVALPIAVAAALLPITAQADTSGTPPRQVAQAPRAEQALPEVRVTDRNALPPGERPLLEPAARVGVLGDRPVLDVPFSVQSFSRELMNTQQSTILRDVLTNDASVQVQTSAGSYASTVTIRGFDVANYYYDGLIGPISSQPDFALDIIESIDVLKGPSSVIFGGGNLAGVGGAVNFVPKRAPRSGSIRTMVLGAETRGAGRASFDLGGRGGSDGQLGYRVNFGHAQGELAARNNDIRNSFVAGSVELVATPKLKFTFDGGRVDLKNEGYQDVLSVPQFPLPAAPDASRNIAQPWTLYRTRSTYGMAKAEWRFAQDWKLDLDYMKATIEQPYYGGALVLLTDPSGNATQDPGYCNPCDRDGGTTRGIVSGKFKTGPLSHDLTFSARRDRIEDTFRGGSYDLAPFGGPLRTNVYRPVYYPEPARLPESFSGGSDARLTTVQIMDFIGLGPKWTVLAGVGRVTIDERIAEYKETKNTPIGALIFKPWTNTSFYVSYAEGLEQGGTAPPFTTNAFQKLAPKAAEQLEIGAKAELRGVQVSAALFEIDRALEFVDARNTFVQSGRQKHRGAEATVSGNVTRDLRMLASATYLDPEIENGDPQTAGNKPAGVPPRAMRVFGEYRLGFAPGLAVNGGATYRSSQYLDLANTAKIPGWTVFDIGASYDLKPALGINGVLRLTVFNLTDRQYWQGVSFNGFGLALGEPRTIRASLALNF